MKEKKKRVAIYFSVREAVTVGQTQFTSSTGSKRAKREQCFLDALENTDSEARV